MLDHLIRKSFEDYISAVDIKLISLDTEPQVSYEIHAS